MSNRKRMTAITFCMELLVLVESSSILGSEYYKTAALQQWTLVLELALARVP
jgi:hypothetical protein